MPIIAKAGADFVPVPEGSHSGVCVDVIDLGILELTYSGQTTKKHMVKVIWQIDEQNDAGKPFIVTRRFTLSLHKKASLRAVLESWRGRAFTNAELSGFDVEKLIGVPGLVNVVHNVSDGSTFANVSGVVKLPKGMQPITPRDYIRVKDRPAENGNGNGVNESDWKDEDVPF